MVTIPTSLQPPQRVKTLKPVSEVAPITKPKQVILQQKTEEQIKLEKRISDLQTNIAKEEKDIIRMQQEAQQISAKTGETPRFLQNQIRILGEKIDSQKRALTIAKDSQSIAELEARKRFTEQAIESEISRQRAEKVPIKKIAIEKVSEVTTSQKLLEGEKQTTIAYRDIAGNLYSIKPEIAKKYGYTPVEIEVKTGKVIESPIIKTLKQPIIKESQRYQELGFTKAESKVLAEESLKKGGMTFTPKEAQKKISPRIEQKQIDTYKGVPVYATYYIDPVKGITRKATSSEEKKFFEQQKKELIIPKKATKTLEKAQEKLIETRREIVQRGKPEVLGIGLGIASSVLGTVEAITKPIETTKGIVSGITTLVKEPERIKDIGKGIGRIIREEPGFAVGFVAAEIVTAKGAGLLIRTGKRVSGIGQEAKILELSRAKPDVSVGFVKRNGDIVEVLVRTIRRTEKAVSDTLVSFNVIKIGEKAYQIGKGKGVQKIITERLVRKPKVDVERVTFFGEARETFARQVKDIKLSDKDLIQLKKDLKGLDVTSTDIKVLFGDKELKVQDVKGFGIARREGDFIQFVGGEITGARARVIRREPFIDLSKEVVRERLTLGIPFAREKPTQVGLLKKIKPKIREPSIAILEPERPRVIKENLKVIEEPTIARLIQRDIVKEIPEKRIKEIGVAVTTPLERATLTRITRRIEKPTPKVIQKITPIKGTTVKESLDLGLGVKQKGQLLSEDTYAQKSRTDFGIKDISKQPLLDQLSIQKTGQLQKPIVSLTPGFSFPGEPVKPKPLPLKIPEKYKKFDLEEIEKEAFRKGKTEGYNSYALQSATKRMKRKWIKLNKEPMTKEAALSRMARIVDNSISARGKIQPVTKKKIVKGKKMEVVQMFDRDKLVTSDGYYSRNQQKFREFKRKGKQKLSTPNTFIERKKYRLDKSGEISKIKTERRRSVIGFFGFGR